MNKRNCSEAKVACVGFDKLNCGGVLMLRIAMKIAEAELLNKLLKADVKLLKDRFYFRKIIEDPKKESE